MILNLLTDLTDPDDIPDGYGKTNVLPQLTLTITIIAIVITLISAFLIYYLYKHSKNENITNKEWIPIAIIIITVMLITLLIVFCYIALNE